MSSFHTSPPPVPRLTAQARLAAVLGFVLVMALALVAVPHAVLPPPLVP